MSGDNHPPYIPLYVNDFYSSGKVTGMTAAAVGAYILLLCQAWSEKPPASIPNNDVVLSRWARMNSVEWAENKAMVLAAFTLGKDNRWHQKRLRLEYDKFRKRSADKSKAGRIGAKKRWKDDDITNGETMNNIAEPCDCHADAITDQCLSSSSSFSENPFPPTGEAPPPDKIRFGKHVFLTAGERQKLGELLGESTAEDYIKRLDLYAEQIGIINFQKRYSSMGHYATILKWELDDRKKNGTRKTEETKEEEVKKPVEDRREKIEAYRRKLEENEHVQERFREAVIEQLWEEISEASWEQWIRPLLVVRYDADVLVLFHEQARWVQDYYATRIGKMVRVKTVKVTDEVEE